MKTAEIKSLPTPYDLCADRKDAYSNLFKNRGLEYIGKGKILTDSFGKPVNNPNFKHFFKFI